MRGGTSASRGGYGGLTGSSAAATHAYAATGSSGETVCASRLGAIYGLTAALAEAARPPTPGLDLPRGLLGLLPPLKDHLSVGLTNDITCDIISPCRPGMYGLNYRLCAARATRSRETLNVSRGERAGIVTARREII